MPAACSAMFHGRPSRCWDCARRIFSANHALTWCIAATDGLTGLTNRRTFDGFLRREYEACEEIAVLLFDIDNFKGYNDTYGHQAGDRCLQAVAKAIGDATANTSGLAARYGGEEFAVVLPNTTEDAALKVAESIRLTVRALGIPNTASSRGYITISA